MAERNDAFLGLLDLGLPDEWPEEDWRALGFRDPAHIKQGFDRLRTRVDIARALELCFADLLRALAQSCDPDQAFAGLERWLEAGGANLSEHALDWTEKPFLHALCTLFAGTPALAEYFIRWPDRTRPVLRPVLKRSLKGGPAWRQQVRAACARAESHAGRLAALRRVHTEGRLQIAALDLASVSRLEDTLRALSDLADACLETALEITVERLKPRYGEIPPQAGEGAAAAPGDPARPPFAVIAMGKLGGRELNYSSDIDLVFAFSGEGRTQGLGRSVPCHEYFTHLGEELIAALDAITEDGRVYRVDMRLRPYGRMGPLVMSVQDTLAYLQTEGRTWERQAWIRARPAAGDLALGEALVRQAQSFVYQRTLSLDSIADIKRLKKQMEWDVQRRGENDDEVKLGRGGIRDIEFTVQFLQLLHGGQYPAVSGGHTLRALQALRKEGLLTQKERERLESAYVFMRQVEHRLQLHGDRQTHKLPAGVPARRRIARSLGYTDTPAEGPEPARRAEARFEFERRRHVDRVREVFEGLFANLFREQRGPEAELSDLLLAPEPDPRALAALLPKFNFSASEQTAKELIALRHEGLILSNPSRTRKFLASLAPLLLRALAVTGDAEGALRRFSRIAHSLGGKAVFYQALNENPWLLRITCDLAAWSEYLTDILVANPELFDELIDALSTDRSKTLETMEAELERLAHGGEVGATLRAYRAGELLRIGVRDLIQHVSLEETQRELSVLAAALLRAQLAHTRKAFEERRGVVKTEAGRPVGFAILALGKFGGGEMNYGSDLDVLYFHGEEGQNEEGWPAGPYFAELVQELTRALAERTALGSLYRLDARLRPNGSKGPLVSSLPAFRHYWQSGALADWERLALTRVHYVAGDAGVGERAEHLIRSAVYSPLQSTGLAEKVHSMHRRIERHTEADDLKGGRGGILDIEFLVQYLQLIHGPAFPKLRQANTKSSLEALIQQKKLKEKDGKLLLEAYAFFSLLANRVRVVHGRSASKLPKNPEDLQKLSLRAGYFDSPERRAGEALRAEHRKYTAAVRAIFERVVK